MQEKDKTRHSDLLKARAILSDIQPLSWRLDENNTGQIIVDLDCASPAHASKLLTDTQKGAPDFTNMQSINNALHDFLKENEPVFMRLGIKGGMFTPQGTMMKFALNGDDIARIKELKLPLPALAHTALEQATIIHSGMINILRAIESGLKKEGSGTITAQRVVPRSSGMYETGGGMVMRERGTSQNLLLLNAPSLGDFLKEPGKDILPKQYEGMDEEELKVAINNIQRDAGLSLAIAPSDSTGGAGIAIGVDDATKIICAYPKHFPELSSHLKQMAIEWIQNQRAENAQREYSPPARGIPRASGN